MQAQTTAGYIRLKHIVGQKPVTEAEAEANRNARKAAIERGDKPPRRPLRARPGIAGVLGVSATTFWELVAQGVVQPPIKVGGSSLWRAEAILALTPEQLSRARPKKREPKEAGNGSL